MQKYSNPIIRGFNPDPSICKVENEFFLVTSSFEFFPGVPIYKSTNLVNWECIGHCLTRKSQLNLDDSKASEGIYAPTIRYHDGRFYMVTTNVSDRGNFIVYTDNIYGEWSDPVWIDQGGIDPSLLFADDKVYFVSNEGVNGDKGIHMCEINPHTGEKLSQSRLISKGCGGRHPEAPHVYKINGMYYLMLAEGGTEYGHMVTIQRSTEPYGPYEICPHNPVLSHRELSSMDINCVGHADMTEDQNGNWWMVALGIRGISYGSRNLMLHNLGRETFLSPMKWADGWPVVGNHGTISLEMDAEFPAVLTPQYPASAETLRTLTDAHAFSYIRNPDRNCYQWDIEHDRLSLHGTAISLSDEGKSPVFTGIRQTAFEMTMEVRLTPEHFSKDGKTGISIFYNNEHHYDLFVSNHTDGYYIAVRKRIYDIEVITAEVKLRNSDSFFLKIRSDKEYYYFYYKDQNGEILLDQGTTAAMCTEITRRMTFTGTFIGLFAENADAYFEQLSIFL